MKSQLDSQIASLRVQLSVLEAQLRRQARKSEFAELYGFLRDASDSSAEEIDAVRYRLPEDVAD